MFTLRLAHKRVWIQFG